MFYTTTASPIGPLLLAGSEAGLAHLRFPTGKSARPAEADWVESAAPFAEVIRQLNAYFAGKLRSFSVPLSPEGSEFQHSVWGALAKIPYGVTVSYGEIARQLNRPTASRAVGAANGQNPLPIIVPCHRVIGTSGALTGFAGGMEAKRWLLTHEGALTDKLL